MEKEKRVFNRGLARTHHISVPLLRLCFQLCTIPHLQSPRRPPGEEVGNLLPGEVLLLLELDEELVVVGRELELGPLGALGRLRHALLPDDTRRRRHHADRFIASHQLRDRFRMRESVVVLLRVMVVLGMGRNMAVASRRRCRTVSCHGHVVRMRVWVHSGQLRVVETSERTRRRVEVEIVRSGAFRARRDVRLVLCRRLGRLHVLVVERRHDRSWRRAIVLRLARVHASVAVVGRVRVGVMAAHLGRVHHHAGGGGSGVVMGRDRLLLLLLMLLLLLLMVLLDKTLWRGVARPRTGVEDGSRRVRGSHVLLRLGEALLDRRVVVLLVAPVLLRHVRPIAVIVHIVVSNVRVVARQTVGSTWDLTEPAALAGRRTVGRNDRDDGGGLGVGDASCASPQTKRKDGELGAGEQASRRADSSDAENGS